MKGRRWLVALFALLLVAAVLAYLPGSGDASRRPSVESRTDRGFRAAFHLLERTGTPVEAWRRPLDQLESRPDLLIVAAPILRRFTLSDAAAVDELLARGGSVAILVSGEPPGIGETELFIYLDLDVNPTRLRAPPPLAWPAWKRWSTTTRELFAPTSSPIEPGMRVTGHAGWYGAPRPPGSRIWLTDEDESPMAFELRRSRGRILLVNDASLWSNGWIGEWENARFLLATVDELLPAGGKVLFDEWHQGGRDIAAAGAGEWVTPFELLIAHVAIVYLLAAWSLSRRFGPKLPPLRRRGEQGAAVLGSLSDLHVRARHSRPAGERLVELVRRRLSRKGRDRGLVPESFDGDERAFVRLAREVGELQRDHEI